MFVLLNCLIIMYKYKCAIKMVSGEVIYYWAIIANERVSYIFLKHFVLL